MSRQIKWVIAALAVSVAINIFMVGLSLGKNVTSGKSRYYSSHSSGLNTRALGRYLSDDERATVRHLLDKERAYIRQNMRRIRQNEEEIRAAFRAANIDQQNLWRLIDEHEALTAGSRAKVQRKLFEFMVRLAPETRRALADDLFKRSKRSERSERREGPPPPPPSRPDEGEEGRP